MQNGKNDSAGDKLTRHIPLLLMLAIETTAEPVADAHAFGGAPREGAMRKEPPKDRMMKQE
jgi:hypothetical protein